MEFELTAELSQYSLILPLEEQPHIIERFTVTVLPCIVTLLSSETDTVGAQYEYMVGVSTILTKDLTIQRLANCNAQGVFTVRVGQETSLNELEAAYGLTVSQYLSPDYLNEFLSLDFQTLDFRLAGSTITVEASYQIDSVSYTFDPFEILYTCQVESLDIIPGEAMSLTHDFASFTAPIQFTFVYSNECRNIGTTSFLVDGHSTLSLEETYGISFS